MKKYLKIQNIQSKLLQALCKSACKQKSSHYVNCKFDENVDSVFDESDTVDPQYRSTCSSNHYNDINNAFNGVSSGSLIKHSHANKIVDVARNIAHNRARDEYSPSNINHDTGDIIAVDVYNDIKDFINSAVDDIPGWGPDQINTQDHVSDASSIVKNPEWQTLKTGLKRVAGSCHLVAIDYCPQVCSCDKVCDCDCNSDY